IARYSSWLQRWKPSHRPKRSDSETFSSTASPGLIAVERSFSIMSRGNRWRRFEVAYRITLSGRPSMPPSSTALSDLYDASLPSKEGSSQNTMKGNGEVRSNVISAGSVSMSSRWISISFKRFWDLRLTLTLAWAALTSDDL